LSIRVLGISAFYHDAAAALVRDGDLIAAAEEERFTRVKHTAEFPARAIDYCLQAAGITAQGLDYVAFYEKPLVKFDRILMACLATWPRSFGQFRRAMPSWLRQKLHLKKLFRRSLGLRPEQPILFLDHHLSHAASAFLVSPFEEAALLTTDALGEWATTATGYARGKEMVLDREIRYPHSLGFFYSALTAYLGFRVNDAEWKVMGLAPYGEDRFRRQMNELVQVLSDGSYRLNMAYFAHHYSATTIFNQRFVRLFGRPPRRPEEPLEDFHRDIACSTQKKLEEAVLALARSLHREHPSRNLALAGGVALNSSANYRLLLDTPFTDLFIQPAAGDGGGAIGAAFYVANVLLGLPRTFTMKHAHFGPGYSAEEVRGELAALGLTYAEPASESDLVKETARLLRRGKLIGWFQGRMEFGPRALGARSILADPTRPEAKDEVNAKVKLREKFRPFAPSVPVESAGEYFELIRPESPFMLLVVPVRPEMRTKIPAVTHVDGTARLQTVREDTHPLFHRLLVEFGRRSGIPVLLNTSFNVRGEPIVCTPRHALSCYFRTGLDALVIGPFIVTEKPRELVERFSQENLPFLLRDSELAEEVPVD
jgi:carbamoyltransferase